LLLWKVLLVVSLRREVRRHDVLLLLRGLMLQPRLLPREMPMLLLGLLLRLLLELRLRLMELRLRLMVLRCTPKR
jgi:hypothetical protein